MTDSTNTTPSATAAIVPPVNQEIEKANGVRNWLMFASVALAILGVCAAVWFGGKALVSTVSASLEAKGDKGKSASGIDADTHTPDLQNDMTTQKVSKGSDVDFDASGKPVIVEKAEAPKNTGGEVKPEKIVMRNRLDEPLSVAGEGGPGGSASFGGGSFGGASSSGLSGGATVGGAQVVAGGFGSAGGLGGGSGVAGGLDLKKHIDAKDVVAEYMKRLNASAGAANIVGGAGVPAASAVAAAAAVPAGPPGALAGMFQASRLQGVSAAQMGDLSFIWPKGRGADCVLDGKIDASSNGYVTCTITSDVYSANGKVLLVEKGSQGFLEYRATNIVGQTRFPLIATEIRTATGVTFNIDSGAQGPLGESGASGHIDNRWTERLGAALLVSFIGDGMSYLTARDASPGAGPVAFQQTQGTAQSIPAKILDSTLNIRPIILKLQGETVRIVAARDVNFSSVYKLALSK